MNNNEILSLAFKLKEMIKNSDLYKNMKSKESDMLNDTECFKLLNDFQLLQEQYNEAKRFEKYGGDVVSSSRKLSEFKANLYNHPLVKEYNDAYNLMKKELKEIERIVFKDIIKEKKEILIEE